MLADRSKMPNPTPSGSPLTPSRQKPRARVGLAGAGLLLAACGGVIPPDPYQGTIDPSGFDVALRFATSSTDNTAACLIPRRGYGGASGSESVTWINLRGLSPSLLDVSNATDPARTLPAAVYQVTGCNAPEGRPGEAPVFDPRLDNYRRDVQYPIVGQALAPALAGGASEPTVLRTYKPWHVVVPVELGADMKARTGCNDIKGERSLLERAGWSRETKLFPESGPTDFGFQFPSRADLQAGRVTVKDWPMVSVSVPIGTTADATLACPFVTNNKAVYPKFPGDPAATFQFPSQHWFRGLLGGYLDGGDLPLVTDPTKCPALIQTGVSCTADADCEMKVAATCSGGRCACDGATKRCLARLPVCPATNDLYVSKDEVPQPGGMGYSADNPIPSTVTLKDPMDMTKTRVAEPLAIFTATPGQTGYSPVCRLRYFDPALATCTHKEMDATVAPRTFCTAQELAAQPMAILKTSDVYVHCLFLRASGK